MRITVRGHEIAGLLDRAPPGLRVLSLDCFDTLIWRATHGPRDVFAELSLPGGAVEPRAWAENVARRRHFNRTGGHEMAIEDIYRWLHPAADDAEIAERVAHELAAEARHAFAFRPVVELIRDARRRGLRVVIVSDMYIGEAQLRAHIAAAAGDDLLAMIDRVFVSSAHGVGKSDGLFDRVLDELNVAPREILHVGDNRAADYDAALRHGLHAAHFQQFDEETTHRLRMEALAATMIDPAARVGRAVCQPHRARLALRRRDDPAFVLGHDVIGPIMHTFGQWLKSELDAKAAALGRPVRPLFIMRDGYLPFRVFGAMHPAVGARAVEISRLVANRASIHDEPSLDAFLDEHLDQLPLKLLARHLMLRDREVADLLKPGAQGLVEPRAAFAERVRAPAMRRAILARTRGFGDKLLAHLRGVGVREGDAVMLVDIGYNGTVQNIITPVLQARMGLDVCGRYLLLREARFSGLDKSGMLDTRDHECRALHGLTTCIAAIEQLCNVEQGSTIDYTRDGRPVREAHDMKAAQNAARHVAQAACLEYVAEADGAIHRPAASDDLAARRRAAAAAIARLFFMPNAREVALYESFNHDVNLGSNSTMRLLDAADGGEGLRRRGLSYVNERWRTYVPGELHRQGLAHSLALFTASRFCLDLRTSDFDVGGIDLSVMMIAGERQAVIDYPAYPTADGYYRARIPVGASRPVLGLRFGALCEIVQIEELSFAALSEVDRREGDTVTPARQAPDGMTEIGRGLYRAEPEGFVLVPPPPSPSLDEPRVLTVVFRPIQWRAGAPALARAA